MSRLPKYKKALIVIDPWDSRQCSNSNFQSVHEEMIQNIRAVMDKVQYTVIASYNKESRDLHPMLVQTDEEDKNVLYSIDKEEILQWLATRDVSILYYAGNSMPGCVNDRPMGLSNVGNFEKILIMDCLLYMMSTKPTVPGMLHEQYHHILDMCEKYKWHKEWSWEI
jgi:hypothetical protein